MTMPIVHKKMLEMRELVIKVADKMDEEKMKERNAERNKKPTQIVGPAGFCELFYCNGSKIKEWRSQGMPYIKSDGGYLYDVAKCQAWFRGEL